MYYYGQGFGNGTTDLYLRLCRPYCGNSKKTIFNNECNFAMPLCYYIVIQKMQVILKINLLLSFEEVERYHTHYESTQKKYDNNQNN